MTYTISRKLNRTGKRVMFYPTINGQRITNTNFARKYDAKNLAVAYIDLKKDQAEKLACGY